MNYSSIVVILLISLLVFSCSKPTESDPGPATVEGILEFFQAPPALGGEIDPSGYVLSEYKWISGEPGYHYTRVYVTDSELAKYVSQRVRVSGNLDTLVAGGISTPRRQFPVVGVINIQQAD